jgi:NAD(P)H-hydrate epimerase
LPDGRATVIPFATPALATAGTGDVLGGTILGLIGQGADVAGGSIAGAYLHGLAGQMLENERGPAGSLAREVADCLPKARRLVNRTNGRSLSLAWAKW